MINIAELLKDCPKGMELDCTMFDNVKFIRVEEDDKPICIRTGDIYRYLTKFGTWTFDDNAKCIIFPKGKTTWEGFHRPFKDGDILISGLGDCEEIPFIFKQINRFGNAECYCAISCYGHLILNNDNWTPIKGCRFATKEEKQKLFDAINKHGYKWNEETKSLEKLVESNEDVDDKIVMSGIYFDRENYADEVELHLGNYEIEVRNGKTYAVFKNQETKISKPIFKVGDKIKHKDTVLTIITVQTNSYIVEDEPYNFGILMFSQQDKWELINEPKFKVGDVIVNNYRKRLNGDSRSWKIHQITNDKYIFTDGSFIYIQDQNNWVLSTDKFDITTLKPFKSKVLVRNYDSDYWKPATFGFAGKDKNAPFCVEGGNFFNKCIPYEGNEHLLHSRNDCDDYYKL